MNAGDLDLNGLNVDSDRERFDDDEIRFGPEDADSGDAPAANLPD